MPISNMVIPRDTGYNSSLASNPFSGFMSFPENFGYTGGLKPPKESLNYLSDGGFVPKGSGLSSLASSFLSGGLGAAGGLLSGLLSNIFAARAQKRQYKYNQQLMNMQNALQRDMIEDDAMLKLQGYKKAGLSTASLGGSFGNAASVPSQSVGAASGSMPDLRLGDIFNAARQVQMQEKALQSQIDLNEANASVARANAREANANAGVTEKYGLDTAQSNLRQIQSNIDYLGAKSDRERAEIQSIFKHIELTDAQIYQINKMLDIEIQKLGPLLRNLAANTAQAYGNANYMNSQANRSNALLPYDIQQAGKNLTKTDTEIKKMESETGLNEQNILYLAQLKQKAAAETDFILARQYEQEFNNAVRDKLGVDFFTDNAKMEQMNLRLRNINQGINAVRGTIGVVGDAAKVVF